MCFSAQVELLESPWRRGATSGEVRVRCDGAERRYALAGVGEHFRSRVAVAMPLEGEAGSPPVLRAEPGRASARGAPPSSTVLAH